VNALNSFDGCVSENNEPPPTVSEILTSLQEAKPALEAAVLNNVPLASAVTVTSVDETSKTITLSVVTSGNIDDTIASLKDYLSGLLHVQPDQLEIEVTTNKKRDSTLTITVTVVGEVSSVPKRELNLFAISAILFCFIYSILI